MLSEIDTKRVTDFFADIAPWEAAYKYACLSYFAVKHDGALLLLQARLFLRITPPNIQPGHFQSSRIQIGNYLLSELGRSPRAIINELLNGALGTPDGVIRFLAGT